MGSLSSCATDLVSGDVDVRHQASDGGAQVLQEAMWGALLLAAHLQRLVQGAEILQPPPLFPEATRAEVVLLQGRGSNA